jgi:hypothetical protein
MADTARALFNDTSDTILSNPEMIRDLLQQGCRQTARFRVNGLGLNLALDPSK